MKQTSHVTTETNIRIKPSQKKHSLFSLFNPALRYLSLPSALHLYVLLELSSNALAPSSLLAISTPEAGSHSFPAKKPRKKCIITHAPKVFLDTQQRDPVLQVITST